MLSKLMKHEFRATARIMLPLFFLVLVTAVGGNLSVQNFLWANHSFLNLLGGLLLGAFIFTIIGICVVTFLLMVQRFYKNLLQDEGYVMLTLPVSIHHHVWSKLLVSVVWQIATAIVVFVSFLILFFNLDFVYIIFSRLLDLLWQIDFDLEAVHLGFLGFEVLLLILLGAVGTCLQAYASLAMGHSFHAYKLGWSVGIYFGTQFVLQLVGGIVTLTVAALLETGLFTAILATLSPLGMMHLMMWALILSSLLICGLFYGLTIYMMKERLNLE